MLLCFIKPILGNRYVPRNFITNEPSGTHPRSEIGHACMRLLALICGVFCGVKPWHGVRSHKHPSECPTKNPALATLEVVKKSDYGTEGRFGHRAVGSQKAREEHVWGIWLQPGGQIHEQKSWLLCIFFFAGLFIVIRVRKTPQPPFFAELNSARFDPAEGSTKPCELSPVLYVCMWFIHMWFVH